MSALRMAVAASLPLLISSGAIAEQSQSIPLWPNGAPGSEGKTAAEAVRLTEQGEHIVSSVHRRQSRRTSPPPPWRRALR